MLCNLEWETAPPPIVEIRAANGACCMRRSSLILRPPPTARLQVSERKRRRRRRRGRVYSWRLSPMLRGRRAASPFLPDSPAHGGVVAVNTPALAAPRLSPSRQSPIKDLDRPLWSFVCFLFGVRPSSAQTCSRTRSETILSGREDEATNQTRLFYVEVINIGRLKGSLR